MQATDCRLAPEALTSSPGYSRRFRSTMDSTARSHELRHGILASHRPVGEVPIGRQQHGRWRADAKHPSCVNVQLQDHQLTGVAEVGDGAG